MSKQSLFAGVSSFSRLKNHFLSSIGNGGIGTKCAETTTRKKCVKIPRSNISGMPRSNSQGQIFQECQGQIPRSRISGMPRSNVKVKFPKVKYFRNVRNVWNVWNVKTKKWENTNENKMGKRKILKNYLPQIFENFVI